MTPALQPPLPRRFVIVDGLVVDGTGVAARRFDVVVDGGRLDIRPPGTVSGIPRVDADGLVVSPGFIDAHSHADLESLSSEHHPALHASRLLQGVTTEVVGNCGFSAFPIPVERSAECARFLGLIFGESVATFPDLDSYSAAVESAGLASNIAPLVGHGSLRASAIGMDDRLPSPDEVAGMTTALEQALRQGSFGLSTGLCYTPAAFAAPAEIVALASVVATAGGIYTTHVRNETDGVFDALNEALAVGRQTGVLLHISHLKVAGRCQRPS